ncbi:MAG: hypothetical protein P0Y56_06055 [Candidatus Andeanibacterium colombiense]|uniref:SMP-30/Gluconolactonase/LRE-like region domain-containing protein n=1 Tax=Candidatus Andeanibacterium colombiense TaxID=3121345 RepID=A0AAJ5XBP1_9SPHN|nr:MAG: hypothetical protein P0Y56_06055 [Sphingomonadaceae bacterium]
MRRIIAAALALASLSPAWGADRTAPIDLPGDRLFPESVSIGPGNLAYVGSLTGGVLRVNLETGTVEQWIAPGAFGSGAQFGVFADTHNHLLWTCTNDFSARGVTVAGADSGTWLKGFDLATGKGKISLQLPDKGAVCNDVAVGKDGALYIADTAFPHILRWKPGSDALEVWKEDPVFGAGLDGIAFGGDGNLYINNVRNGALFRVGMGADGSAGAVTQLKTSRPLVSPDGMRAMGGMRFALAESSGTVSRLKVKGNTVEVTQLAEKVSQPTGVDVAGNTVWYVQGHVGALFNPARPQPALPFRLTPVPNR